MTVLALPGLSALMRDGSQAEHRDAEGSAFMAALVRGEVDAPGYATYLARLAAVYAALEQVGSELAGDPALAAIVDPALFRGAALAADLAFWAGAGQPGADTPAVAAYTARIEATRGRPELYVAHHYTRYLGDLSGGQVIGRVLARQYGLVAGEGVAFYRFEGIAKVKPYKDAYRARLDALDLDDDARAAVVAEVRVAFALNQALFDELGRDLGSEGDADRRHPATA